MDERITGRDFIQRFYALEEKVRQLELAYKHHTESKTFLVHGGITVAMVIPPFHVHLDEDRLIPESKQLLGFRAFLETGACSIWWYLNGVAIPDAHHIVTTDPTYEPITLPAPIELTDGDLIKPYVLGVGVGTVQHLSAAVKMGTRAT